MKNNPYYILAYIMVQEMFDRFEKQDLLDYLTKHYRVSKKEIEAVENIWNELYGDAE